MPDRLQALLEAALGPDLLSADYRASWSADNPTAGLCSVASEAAWFVLGGLNSPWVPQVVRDGNDGTHWWLENTSTGERYDPTQAQYRSQGRKPPYERGRLGKGAGFMGLRRDPGNPWGFDRKPSQRAARLLERMLVLAGADSPQALRTQLNGSRRPRPKR